MRRSIAFLSAAIVGWFVLLQPASATINLAGAAVDQTAFLNMINGFSTGGAWTAPVGILVFTANGKPLNHFATIVNAIVQDPAAVTLQVGRNQPGVVVGAFMGGGVQVLDLADIAQFPAGHPFLSIQASVTLHEITEVFRAVSTGAPNNFLPAHLIAIGHENGEIAANLGRGLRAGPPDAVRPVRPGVIEVLIPWSDITNPRVTTMIVQIQANAITNVRSGIINTGTSYDGTELDIPILQVYFE